MTKPLIDQAVDRFLGWKLPQDFNPDCGISFTIPVNATWFPTGTNLLNAIQAKAMLEYVAAPLLAHASEASPVILEVQAERQRQDEKWGPEQDDKYNPLDWHEIMADYNGWARRMLCMGSISKGRRRLIQLAAIAVAEVEALDRRFPDLAMDDHGDHPDRP